ncbi:uncharacterized protein H6S33_006316 [Morchella sextelata]|uniref:uncharacterized protein n=1 Tax=Morchella sextelata TaxID=1174677 RepID=UPI001D03B216|nr:uncharacterized protein H6S33_006316 [Morchella sextelata]KAH0604648.1 hypothetical protein H6S33_006316 [Morchella sextelata]
MRGDVIEIPQPRGILLDEVLTLNPIAFLVLSIPASGNDGKDRFGSLAVSCHIIKNPGPSKRKKRQSLSQENLGERQRYRCWVH